MSVSLLTICLLVVVGVSVAAPSKNCNKNQFDTHAANVFAQFGLDELNFPESPAQLSKYCRQARTSTDFAKKYGENCLTGTSQTLMSLASYNFDKVNKPYCAKNGKKKAQFVDWAKCGNPAKVNTKKCWSDMIMTMAMTEKVVNTKSRIPLVCCTYYNWIKCTRKAMEDMGAATCPKGAVDGYMEFINKASVDSMNLICSRYQDDPVKCAALRKEVPESPKPKKLQKTPLLYVFDLFDNL